MVRPARSLSERKRELIDAQEYLSEKEKRKAKEEIEKAEKTKTAKKEETRKILEEEQKEFEKAAEKSAALGEITLFSEEDFERDDKDESWYKEFGEGLKDEPEYLSFADRARQAKSDTVFNTYNTGEEWLMSEDEDDFSKAFINNFRSAIGTGVEDLAYAINDYAPWYEPAETVLRNNTAGKIEAKAQRQFENIKARGVNENFVDLMDSVSKGLGYSVFGLKAGSYIQDGADVFNEYRTLRDSGLSREETVSILAKKAPMYILSAKADDYIGKNGKVDEMFGIVGKADIKPPYFEIKSSSDSQKVLDYLDYVKKESTIKYGNEDVRKWYVNTTSQIHKMIDESLPNEEKAQRAFALRNEIRTGARNIMQDTELRKKLDVEHTNYTFDELVESKMRRKGMTREEAIQDIYETAVKTNKEVNSIWGIKNG